MARAPRTPKSPPQLQSQSQSQQQSGKRHWSRRIPVLGTVLLPRPVWTGAVALGLICFVLLGHWPREVRLTIAWDFASLVYLVVITRMSWRASPTQLRQRAQRLDTGAALVLTLTLAGVAISLGALFGGLHEAKQLSGSKSLLPPALAAATILLSWTLTQSMFALHYAHLFYGNSSDDARKHRGGLEFPGNQAPDFADFLYFAFVLGMTFQVSDVQISDRHLRRLATAHGMISFFFNTVILALAVNIAAGLIG